MWLFEGGGPLHTLVVSYLHPCEAALVKRFEAGTRAPHAELDNAKFLLFWIDHFLVLKKTVHTVEDSNFVLVAMAQRGNVEGMRYVKENFGATLFHEAAVAASKMGFVDCLRFALSSSSSSNLTLDIGRDIYLAAFASQNEKGSIDCLNYIQQSRMCISSRASETEIVEAVTTMKTLSWEQILSTGRTLRACGFDTINAACIAAARSGSVTKFDYAYFKATTTTTTTTTTMEQHKDHLWPMNRADHERGRLEDRIYSAILDAAAFGGHLAILKRLREHDSKYRHPGMVGYGHVAAVAAIRGHLDCVQWAIEVAGPHANHYENRIFQHSAEVGSIECMQLALGLEQANSPIHVSIWFINAVSPQALECIHRLCSHRLTRGDYAQAMWQAIYHPERADNILVLNRWFNVVENETAEGFLRLAAKFNRISALHHLKTIGAIQTRQNPALALTLDCQRIQEPSPPTYSTDSQTTSTSTAIPWRPPPTFWKYGYLE